MVSFLRSSVSASIEVGAPSVGLRVGERSIVADAGDDMRDER
jgi:hypothetical protein